MAGTDGAHFDASYFHACNRGKRSLEVDLATTEGQSCVRALAANADIVIENYKVGGLARYGLDYRSLKTANKGLIYCSITGFGQSGPYAQRPGYDFVVQAMGGLMSVTGEIGRPPQKAGISVCDLFTGIYSAVAILAALQQRQRTGQGAHIDMALLDTQVAVLGNQALNWMTSGIVPSQMGNGHFNLVPYQSFPTREGELVIAVGNDRQYANLCETLGVTVRPEHATNALRVADRDGLIVWLSERTRTWDAQALADRLEAVGVPAGPINTIDQVFNDPQVRMRRMQIEAEGDRRNMPGVASPIVIDGQRMVEAIASPRLGQHNSLRDRVGGDKGWPARTGES